MIPRSARSDFLLILLTPIFANRRLPTLLLILIVVCVYVQTMGFGFIDLDDPQYIFINPWVSEGMTFESVRWAFEAGLKFRDEYIDYWQPMTILSRLLDVEVHGFNPGGHHLTNLILHAFNAVLLFFLLDRMTLRRPESFFAAAIFAAHPAHVASVAWIVERKDVLFLFFSLWTFWAFHSFTKRPRLTTACGVIAVHSLALASKPMAASVPLLLILLAYWPLRFPLRRMTGLLAALALLSVASLYVTTFSRGNANEGVASVEIFCHAPIALLIYLGKVFVPVHLAVVHSFPIGGCRPAWSLTASAVLVFVTIFAVRGARSRPYVLMGWLWFLLSFLPVMGLGMESHAERFTYMPYIGIYILVAWTIGDMARNHHLEGPAFAAGAAVIVVLTGLSWKETGYWSDTRILFHRAIEVQSDNYLAHKFLAMTSFAVGDDTAGFDHLDLALRMNPGDVEMWSMKGMHLQSKGEMAAALVQFDSALSIRPGHPSTLFWQGMVLYRLHRDSEALRNFEAAMASDPDHPELQRAYGATLLELGRPREALPYFYKALASVHDKSVVEQDIAKACFLMDEFDSWYRHLAASVGDRPVSDIDVTLFFIKVFGSDRPAGDRLDRARAWAVKSGVSAVVEGIDGVTENIPR